MDTDIKSSNIFKRLHKEINQNEKFSCDENSSNENLNISKQLSSSFWNDITNKNISFALNSFIN